eukprot:8230177-Karenia_brevis.AAC.1
MGYDADGLLLDEHVVSSPTPSVCSEESLNKTGEACPMEPREDKVARTHLPANTSPEKVRNVLRR